MKAQSANDVVPTNRKNSQPGQEALSGSAISTMQVGMTLPEGRYGEAVESAGAAPAVASRSLERR